MDVRHRGRALGQHTIGVRCNYVLIQNYGRVYFSVMWPGDLDEFHLSSAIEKLAV